MKEVLISIIMPAYNASSYIQESIDSIIKQTYKSWELIIIDDGSTDDTSLIVKDCIKRDSRIKLIHQQNQKLGAARNTGFKNASGDLIAFLDSDDLWVKDKLEIQVAYLKKNPDVSVIFSDGYIFFDDSIFNTHPYPTSLGRFTGKEMYKKEYITNYIPVLSVVMKKSLVERIGEQETFAYFYGCEDWDFWLRCAMADAIFLGIPEKLFYYRRHSANMSSNILQMQLAQATLFIKNYRSEFFSRSDKKDVFNKFIPDLLKKLYKYNKKDEVDYILKGMKRILPLEYNFINRIILEKTDGCAFSVYEIMLVIKNKFFDYMKLV